MSKCRIPIFWIIIATSRACISCVTILCTRGSRYFWLVVMSDLVDRRTALGVITSVTAHNRGLTVRGTCCRYCLSLFGECCVSELVNRRTALSVITSFTTHNRGLTVRSTCCCYCFSLFGECCVSESRSFIANVAITTLCTGVCSVAACGARGFCYNRIVRMLANSKDYGVISLFGICSCVIIPIRAFINSIPLRFSTLKIYCFKSATFFKRPFTDACYIIRHIYAYKFFTTIKSIVSNSSNIIGNYKGGCCIT